ncbi:MAG: hypothetical protein ABJE66_05235 [Deltaproteobacteria bacterium]
MRLLWWCVLGVMAFAACGDNTELMPVDTVGTSRVLRRSVPLASNQTFDILFVIDDSPAMAPFATQLAANEREMIQLLTPMFGPDLHLGVITADPADGGKLRATTGADFLTTAIQFDFSVQTNVSGPLADAFVALADVGSAGGATTQPLAMAQAALALGANPGFRRDDAHLGVVFMTAGDDSSPGAVSDYANALHQLGTDPSDVAVGIASGPCNTSSLSAPEAPRLTAFAAQSPNRARHVAVCDDSFADLASSLLQLRRYAGGEQCIDEPLAMPLECSFWLEHRATSEQRIIEPCPESTSPCWSIVRDPMCSAEPHIGPKLVPFPFPETGVTEEIQCVVE